MGLRAALHQRRPTLPGVTRAGYTPTITDAATQHSAVNHQPVVYLGAHLQPVLPEKTLRAGLGVLAIATAVLYGFQALN